MKKLLKFIIFFVTCIFSAKAYDENTSRSSGNYSRDQILYTRKLREYRSNIGNYLKPKYNNNHAYKEYPQVMLPGSSMRRPYPNFNRNPFERPSFTKRRPLYSPRPVKKCGVMKPQVRNYVANGESTNHSDWPWYVQIIIKSDAEAYCGGTIISDNYILTAAHCFDEISKENLAFATTIFFKGVRIKKMFRNNYEEVKMQATEVHLHPYYVPAMTQSDANILGIEPGPKNDIAIIRFDTSDNQILEQIIPACLPAKRYSIPISTKCKIMGHGFTDTFSEDNFRMPKFLQMADVYISQNEICKQEVDSEVIKSKINPDTLCIRGPIHPCVGDSGGPLVCKGVTPNNIHGETTDSSYDYESYPNDDSEWYLAGVTSFAVSTDLNDKCGLFKSAVFGKVSNHMDWIRSVISI